MKVVQGSILDLHRGILVHGVNAQGKFNSGVAKQIRETYPVAYNDYMHAFENHGLKLGQVILSTIEPGLIIASGVTQQHYGREPNVVYVKYDALREVFHKVEALGIAERLPVAFPRIGAGLANGYWPTIERIIQEELMCISDVTLYVQKEG